MKTAKALVLTTALFMSCISSNTPSIKEPMFAKVSDVKKIKNFLYQIDDLIWSICGKRASVAINVKESKDGNNMGKIKNCDGSIASYRLKVGESGIDKFKIYVENENGNSSYELKTKGMKQRTSITKPSFMLTVTNYEDIKNNTKFRYPEGVYMFLKFDDAFFRSTKDLVKSKNTIYFTGETYGEPDYLWLRDEKGYVLKTENVDYCLNSHLCLHQIYKGDKKFSGKFFGFTSNDFPSFRQRELMTYKVTRDKRSRIKIQKESNKERLLKETLLSVIDYELINEHPRLKSIIRGSSFDILLRNCSELTNFEGEVMESVDNNHSKWIKRIKKRVDSYIDTGISHIRAEYNLQAFHYLRARNEGECPAELARYNHIHRWRNEVFFKIKSKYKSTGKNSIRIIVFVDGN